LDKELYKAMEFLSRKLELVQVPLEAISGSVYDAGDKLKSCTIYRLDSLFQAGLGPSIYLAVPNDTSSPFYLSVTGE
jgi:hypothetical protein